MPLAWLAPTGLLSAPRIEVATAVVVGRPAGGCGLALQFGRRRQSRRLRRQSAPPHAA